MIDKQLSLHSQRMEIIYDVKHERIQIIIAITTIKSSNDHPHWWNLQLMLPKKKFIGKESKNVY